MTPEQRAKEVVEYGCKHFGAVKVACQKCIVAAIREAVAAELEAQALTGTRIPGRGLLYVCAENLTASAAAIREGKP